MTAAAADPVAPPVADPAAPPVAPPVDPPTPPAAPPPANDPAAPTPPPAASDPAKPGESAPATYTLTLPDQSPLDGLALDAIKAEAKALGLTQAQAQQLVQSRHDALASTIASLDGQLADIKADPVLGGAHYDTTIKHVQAGMRWGFGDQEPAARAIFDSLGLSNNKVLVGFLAKVGKAVAEDTPTSGAPAGQSTTRKPTADVLYPTTAAKE